MWFGGFSHGLSGCSRAQLQPCPVGGILGSVLPVLLALRFVLERFVKRQISNATNVLVKSPCVVRPALPERSSRFAQRSGSRSSMLTPWVPCYSK